VIWSDFTYPRLAPRAFSLSLWERAGVREGMGKARPIHQLARTLAPLNSDVAGLSKRP
jgi:hypothetical protein